MSGRIYEVLVDEKPIKLIGSTTRSLALRRTAGEVNVETSADGQVVSVWFRCMPLPFDQTIVGKERAADMVRMYGEIDKRNIVAVEVADLGGR
jgi:hypothetical protein